MFNSRLIHSLLVVVVSALLGCQAPEREGDALSVTVATVLKAPAKYDGKLIAVSGEVSGVQKRTSAKGNKYTVFKVKEGSQSLSVFSFEHLDITEGNKVRVTGTFAETKEVGANTF